MQLRVPRPSAHINVTPMVDVMLVLLIIFMVVAPLLQQGIKVDLPKAGAEPIQEDPTRKNEPLIMSVDREGNFYLNFGGKEDAPIAEEELMQRVAAVLRREPTTSVLVKADKNVAYGRVVTGMVLLQRAGAAQVGFITDPADVRAAKRPI